MPAGSAGYIQTFSMVGWNTCYGLRKPRLFINPNVGLKKKKYDEYLGLEQKVQQIAGLRKKSKTKTWNLNKKYNK